MKNKFAWYFPLSDAQIDEIWTNGILTVDTNVLLDLYRYHESTRSSLIESLKSFEGRKWLSYQASTEFIRNRTKVIISAEKTFKQAADEADKLNANLQSSINQLKGNRIIASEVTDELGGAIGDAIKKLRTQIQTAKENYPRFIQNDPVLAQVAELFDNAVGDPFSKEALEDATVTAEQRKVKNVPPGYLDKDKSEERPYGDYFLWRQILEKAKSENTSIVLVTSERSEDWWEIISGKTTGPRPEMLKEAFDFIGKPILIYQTDRFLEAALKRFSRPVSNEAIEEIRAVSTLRTAQQNAVTLIEQVVTTSSSSISRGYLRAQLNRPLRSFTVSGHFEPNMEAVPAITVKVIEAPGGVPDHRIKAGTGTMHDFNVHLSAEGTGTMFPEGEYNIYYDATCAKIIEDSPTDGGVVAAEDAA
jgi:hypothetical protein